MEWQLAYVPSSPGLSGGSCVEIILVLILEGAKYPISMDLMRVTGPPTIVL
jgi:hypothetical protein